MNRKAKFLLIAFICSIIYFSIRSLFLSGHLVFKNLFLGNIFEILLLSASAFVPASLYISLSEKIGNLKSIFLTIPLALIVPILSFLLLFNISSSAGYSYDGWGNSPKTCTCNGVSFTFDPSMTDTSSTYHCLGKVSDCFYDSDFGRVYNPVCYKQDNKLEFEMKDSIMDNPEFRFPFEAKIESDDVNQRFASAIDKDKFLQISPNKFRLLLDNKFLPNKKYGVRLIWYGTPEEHVILKNTITFECDT
ncbi:MAG: hypothetical protein AABX33_09140 [Nanoarchaeota archaeon]